MRCDDLQRRLRSYIDGELTPSGEREIRSHLESCPACHAAYDRLNATVSLLQELPLEEPPAHFTTSLQVRLAHLRADRARHSLPPSPPPPLARRATGLPTRAFRYALTTATLAAAILGLIGLAQPRIGAAELVGKVQESWARLRNYQCTFVSEGVVNGAARRFEQRQWFRKPDLFRLETNEHYPQVTYLERDRVSIFMPGAEWAGRPVAILRPRKGREAGLPFPFGAEWPETDDITIDALVRELQERRGAEVLGTESVLDKSCFVLKFHTVAAGNRRVRHYLMWINRESFLPLRVKRHENAQNHLMTEAVDLKVNTVFPSDTFRFEPPRSAFVARGDVHPHVFALRPQRTEAFDRAPTRTARYLLASRGRSVPFRPLAPAYLPPDYALIRVRAARDRWLDAYWVENDSGRMVKLVEQAGWANDPPETEAGRTVTIPAADGERRGRLATARIPYPHHYLSWKQDGVSLLLATAELPLNETVRIAGSMERVGEVPEPAEPPAPATAAMAGGG